jgi:hypothetical protein
MPKHGLQVMLPPAPDIAAQVATASPTTHMSRAMSMA